MLAGVAAGIADHLAVDVAIVRLLIVVATVITSGVGVLVYIAAIFVIPEADPGQEQRMASNRSATMPEGSRDPAFWVGVVLLVLGALWLLGGVLGPRSPWGLFPGVYLRDLLLPLVLIGFGLALWKASDRRGTTNGATPPPPPPAPTAPPGSAGGYGAAGPVAPPPSPAEQGHGAGAGDDEMTTPLSRPETSVPVPPPSASTPSGTAATDAQDASGTGHRDDDAAGPRGDDAADRALGVDAADDPLGEETADGSRGDGGDAWGDGGDAYGDGDGAWGDGGATPPPGVPGPPGNAASGPADGGGSWTPPEPPRRSWLTRLTLGAALVTVGVLWLLRLADVVTIGTSRLFAVALLVVGLGLLVGSWFGRGRWLILVGGLLLPVVVAAELLRPFGVIDLPRADVRSGFGEIAISPAELDELESSYQVGAGSLVLDLGDLEIDEPTRLELQVGAGEAIVHLPSDVTADVTAKVAAGEVWIDGRSSAGLGVPERTERLEHGDGSELLTLDVTVGFGEARIDPGFDTFDPPDALRDRDPVASVPVPATPAS